MLRTHQIVHILLFTWLESGMDEAKALATREDGLVIG